MPLNRTLQRPDPFSSLSKLDGSLELLTDSDPIVGGPLPRLVFSTGSRGTRRNLFQSKSIRGLIANRQAQTTAALTSTEVQYDIVTKSHEKSVDLRRGFIKMARRSEMAQTLGEKVKLDSRNHDHVDPTWTKGCF